MVYYCLKPIILKVPFLLDWHLYAIPSFLAITRSYQNQFNEPLLFLLEHKPVKSTLSLAHLQLISPLGPEAEAMVKEQMDGKERDWAELR